MLKYLTNTTIFGYLTIFLNQKKQQIMSLVKYFTNIIMYRYYLNTYMSLKYINNQTDEICLEAVKNDGRALQFVQNQTDEICSFFVPKKHEAIDF